jgi:hypothetical protein
MRGRAIHHATIPETEMTKTRMTMRDEHSALPDPIALTPDQLKEIATATAGGLLLAPTSIVIRAGGIPPAPYLSVGNVAAAY